jgi:nitrous oxidase accessory protein
MVVTQANFSLPPPIGESTIIENDGTVQPLTAPIQRTGNVYRLTRDILNSTLVIQCDNILVDGCGYGISGVESWYTGVTLSGRRNVVIQNLMVNGYGSGIQMSACQNITIRNNYIRAWSCIELVQSSYNTICENIITSRNPTSGYGLSIVDIGSHGNYINTNNFTEIQVGVDLGGRTDLGGQCGENLLTENNFYKNVFGALVCSNSSTLANNFFSQISYGVSLNGCYNVIFNNTVTNATKCAIEIFHSLNNSIYGNNLVNNALAVKIGNKYGDYSEKNIFYCINFVSNTQDAIIINLTSPFNNYWDNGTLGNYWSDNHGIDLDNDGIVDQPFQVASNATDNYPITKPADITTLHVQLPNLQPPPYLPDASPNPTSNLSPMPSMIPSTIQPTPMTSQYPSSYSTPLVSQYPSQTGFTVSLAESASAINFGNSVNFTVAVEGGFAPYSYAWYVDNSLAETTSSPYYSIDNASVGAHHVFVNVTDVSNNTAETLTVEFNVLPNPSSSSLSPSLTMTEQPTPETNIDSNCR